jgi:hypothetical protein
MTHIENIRRCPDGSIDTHYYVAKGRLARSEQAHLLIGKIFALMRSEPTDSVVVDLHAAFRGKVV